MTSSLVDSNSNDSATLQKDDRRKIVVIDDEKDFAKTVEWEIEDAGYEPFLIVEGNFKEVNDLVSQIPQDTFGVLCDHRLSKSGLADFYGSDLVATLYDLKIPALLDTQFYDMDSDVSIRRRRHKIPVLLNKDNVDSNTITEGIQLCHRELNGNVLSHRRPHRNIMWIVDLSKESGDKVVDVIIPGWNPSKAVRLPVSLIEEWITEFQPEIGKYLIANVNNGASNSEDLYFTHFEIAPEPEEV